MNDDKRKTPNPKHVNEVFLVLGLPVLAVLLLVQLFWKIESWNNQQYKAYLRVHERQDIVLQKAAKEYFLNLEDNTPEKPVLDSNRPDPNGFLTTGSQLRASGQFRHRQLTGTLLDASISEEERELLRAEQMLSQRPDLATQVAEGNPEAIKELRLSEFQKIDTQDLPVRSSINSFTQEATRTTYSPEWFNENTERIMREQGFQYPIDLLINYPHAVKDFERQQMEFRIQELERKVRDLERERLNNW